MAKLHVVRKCFSQSGGTLNPDGPIELFGERSEAGLQRESSL